MPVFNTKTLLASLEADVAQMLPLLDQLHRLDAAALNAAPAPGKWSVLQVLEHLNSYNRYYLPELSKALQNGKALKYNDRYKPGMFGNYFTKMMLPDKDGAIANKMNAPKDHTPPAQLDPAKVMDEFKAGQNKLLKYLQEAALTDMAKLKVPISISRFIKLKLGDTFRFLIAHQQRHFIQLHKALAVVNSNAPQYEMS